MHRRVIHNQRLLEASKARLPVLTGATLYGRGVFTTLAIYRGQPFLWDQHWARLLAHAGRAGVSHQEFTEAAVREALGQLIEANKCEEGRARVTLLSRAARGVWDSGKDKRGVPETDLLIMTGDARPVPAAGLALTLSPYRVNSLAPLAGIKSINYLEHLMSWEEARARDFDEAVRLNEQGEVVSATMANLFWTREGTLYTPALSTGALAGTTRARVIELIAELAVPQVEGVFDLAHLGDADEIFLTSAGLGVAPVTSFDFHRYTAHTGSLAVRVQEAFRQLTL